MGRSCYRGVSRMKSGEMPQHHKPIACYQYGYLELTYFTHSGPVCSLVLYLEEKCSQTTLLRFLLRVWTQPVGAGLHLCEQYVLCLGAVLRASKNRLKREPKQVWKHWVDFESTRVNRFDCRKWIKHAVCFVDVRTVLSDYRDVFIPFSKSFFYTLVYYLKSETEWNHKVRKEIKCSSRKSATKSYPC